LQFDIIILSLLSFNNNARTHPLVGGGARRARGGIVYCLCSLSSAVDIGIQYGHTILICIVLVKNKNKPGDDGNKISCSRINLIIISLTVAGTKKTPDPPFFFFHRFSIVTTIAHILSTESTDPMFCIRV
jgi:hypothetical protein